MNRLEIVTDGDRCSDECDMLVIGLRGEAPYSRCMLEPDNPLWRRFGANYRMRCQACYAVARQHESLVAELEHDKAIRREL